MEKQQTAVEFMVEQLTAIGQLEIPKGSNSVTLILNQAKAMHKEQSECICVNVIEMILDESEQGKEINSKEIFEKCYEEIFKSE